MEKTKLTRRAALFFTLAILSSLFASSSAARGGEKREPNVYFAYRSFLPEYETMKRFASVGVHTYCVFPANTTNSLGEPYSQSPPFWRYNDVYDKASLYRQFDEILAFDPDAEFLCLIDLNTPIWLARQLEADGDGSFDSFTELSNCLYNKTWWKETERYLAAFLETTEERYSKKIRAYVLSCGQTSEWLDHGAEQTSRAKLDAYREWEKRLQLPELPFPSLEEFDALLLGGPRDPQREQKVIQATKFQQELIADSIVRLARLVKEKTNGREVGAFFGYVVELTGWRATCGHLAYEKVMRSDAVDFFISPSTYRARSIGEGSGSMIPNETVSLNGKRRLLEVDHRTSTFNYDVNGFVKAYPLLPWENAAQDVAGRRRELALALVDRASIWFFDMLGGAFDYDGAMENVATMKRVWDENQGRQGASAAEVLLIVDPQSKERTNARRSHYGHLFMLARNALNHIGAPFSVCSFEDLATIDLSKIKLALLPETHYLTSERRELLRERLLRDGRTVLWIGPAGRDDGATIDFARVAQTTGSEYDPQPQKDAVATPIERKGAFGEGDGEWRSVALFDYEAPTPSFARELARDSGVKIYVEDGSPVYASERLVAVHTKEGGVKRATLPRKVARVVEAFSQKTIAENVDAFEYGFAAPETALFILEDGEKK